MQYDRMPSPQSQASIQRSFTPPKAPPPPRMLEDAATTRPSRTASVFQDVYERLNSLETGLAHVLDMQARLERVEHMLGSGNPCQSPRRSPVPAFEGAVNFNGP